MDNKKSNDKKGITLEITTPPVEVQEFKFIISPSVKEKELAGMEAKIAEIIALLQKEGKDAIPDYLKDSIKTPLIRLEYERDTLKMDTNPVLINRIAFTSFIHSLPKGLLGEGTIVINLMADGGYNLVMSNGEHKKFPKWESYGYSFTAQSICDKLGISDKGASANDEIHRYAKREGITLHQAVAKAQAK